MAATFRLRHLKRKERIGNTGRRGGWASFEQWQQKGDVAKVEKGDGAHRAEEEEGLPPKRSKRRT
jgi:hypothetical protein